MSSRLFLALHLSCLFRDLSILNGFVTEIRFTLLKFCSLLMAKTFVSSRGRKTEAIIKFTQFYFSASEKMDFINKRYRQRALFVINNHFFVINTQKRSYPWSNFSATSAAY